MSLRISVLLAGGLLAVFGFFALFLDVLVFVDGVVITEMSCGNGFGVVSERPIVAPQNWRTLCNDAVSDRQSWAWPLLGAGVLVAVVAAFMQTGKDRQEAF